MHSTEFQVFGPYWTAKTQWTSVLGTRTTLDASANLFYTKSTRKSHVQKTPYSDSVTLAIRGGFPNPRVTFRKRWQNSATLSHFTDKLLQGSHDFKFGYGMILEDNRGDDFGAPGEPSKSGGHVQLIYADGKPDSIRVTDTPNHFSNHLAQNYFFIQDRWQPTRGLTINAGFRFDRYSGSLPPQGNPGSGPFSSVANYQRRHVATFRDLVPRISVVYDLFGSTRTALKASWGRFAENTATDLAGSVNPVSTKTYRYAWNGTLPVTPQVVARSALLSITGQTSVPTVDPTLHNAHTDQYTLGFDHEVVRGFGLSFTYVRNLAYDTLEVINRAYRPEDYSPLRAIDTGPDGTLGTGDDRVVQIYERIAGAREDDDYLTNFRGGANWSSFEISATRRFIGKWQLTSGFEWDKTNSQPPRSFDPNLQIWEGGVHYTSWAFKTLAVIELPRGLQLSGTYEGQKGAAYGRTVQFSGAGRNMLDSNGSVRLSNLAQGVSTITMQPAGSYFMPNVHLINLRLEKTFRIKEDQRLTAMFDAFNVINANSVIGVETLSNTVVDRSGRTVPRFGRPTTILNPAIFRLGVRYRF